MMEQDISRHNVQSSGLYKRYIRFTLAGALATAIHYSVMFAGLWLGSGPIFWSFIGATCGSLVGYLTNYYFTFESKVPHKFAVSRYLIIVLLSIGLNTLAIFTILSLADLSVLFAQIISTVIVFVTNFVAHSRITFKL